MNPSTLKRLGTVLLLLVVLTDVYGYKDKPAQVLYVTSENEQYMLEILPTFDMEREHSQLGMSRKKLTIFVYRKESQDIDGEQHYSWKEVSFFRAFQPYNVGATPAEVNFVFISNDGNTIVVESRRHPWFHEDFEAVFIYNQDGSLVRSYWANEIYWDYKNDSSHRFQILLDEANCKLVITDGRDTRELLQLNLCGTVQE